MTVTSLKALSRFPLRLLKAVAFVALAAVFVLALVPLYLRYGSDKAVDIVLEAFFPIEQ